LRDHIKEDIIISTKHAPTKTAKMNSCRFLIGKPEMKILLLISLADLDP
jgi:hypothetical protein